MNNQKPDPKAVDQEDGDHTQPINLVAQRAAVPITTFSGQSSQSAVTQPVTMRAHIDPTKSALMTLYFRAPTASRPPGPGQVIAPVMAASVASAQHFTAKPGFKGFKGLKVGYYQDKTTEKSGGESFNIKVIRMPANDASQSQGVSTTQTASGTPAPGLLPASISATSTSRHIVPTAVHSAVASGSSNCGPMASIIRSAHQVPQTSHVMHQPYSSHVPRGPAAVASISAAPKSAVATPILRPPHSSATVTLASASSMITTHPPTRSPTLVAGRTTTPPVPVASSPAVSQVIDLQKGSTSHSLSSSQVQIGLTSRSVEGTGAAIRTGVPHASSITIAKPINISQPIVQHLQQVNEKGFLKTVSSVVTSVSAAPSNSSPHQSSSATPGAQITGSDAQSLGVMSNITRTAVPTISVTAAAVAPSVAYSSSILPLSTAASVAQHSVSSLRPSLVQPPSVHSLTTTANVTTVGPVAPHQTFTVISAKTLPQSNQSVTLAAPPARASTPGPSIAATSGTAVVTCTSVLSVSASRPLNAANSLCQAAIPVAKVYPQPLPVPTQPSIELSSQENPRSGVFIAQSQHNTLTTAATATTAAVTSSMTPVPQAVVLSESRSESSAVRFPSLPKAAVGSGASYAVPPAAYYYETYPVPGTIAMHPYPVSSSNQGFAATIPSSPPLRPGIFPQHGSGTLSSSHPPTCAAASPVAPVRPLNSLMVTVDPSRHHVALHPTYNPVPSGGISSAEVVVTQTSCTTGNLYTVAKSGSAPVGLSSSSLVSTSFNSAQSQGNISNHNTSPRPSILRKRTSDGVSAVAKKNLMANISSSDPTSPHPDTVSNINITTAPSPKPFGDQLRENGSVGAIIDSEVNRISLVASTVTIKKEPGIFEKGFCASNNDANSKLSIPVETSPRKKPRKQLLAANELIETHSSDGEDEFEKDVKENIKKEFCREDEETIKWVTFCKRPSMSLLNSYRHTWKSRHNHFVRYTDVKPKEEKKLTVNDLANQKGVLQKANGWKIYHLTAQMDEVIGLEDTVYSRLSQLLDFVEKDPPAWKTKPLNSDEDKILNKLTDLIKGNLQRSKIVQDQVTEAKQQVIKVLEHKPHIVDIVSKYISKRPVKKKEKN